MTDPLATLLDIQGVAILDGGLATELEARGYDLGDPLWSARLLLEAPEAIRRLHADYLAAGADCLVTASYQASLEGLARRGLGAADAEGVLRLSVELARDARRGFLVGGRHGDRHRPLVAASVGPYGAFLADGSEYTGDYGVGAAELTRFHGRRLAILADAGADLLACETVPSAAEARVLAELLDRSVGPPAWISFSCQDGERICDGTPLASIAAEVTACARVVAVGVNCTAPRHVAPLVTALAAETGLPIVVYPNSGERYEPRSGGWNGRGRATALAELAPLWVESGARLVGGCCRVGPAEIRRLRRRLLA